MSNTPTPHIDAHPGDFAPTVLMPGDPLRSQFIAENYLEDRRLVNNVRGVQGYTGTYKGVPVSVMASGMGMASIGIYSYELFNFFGVENILRVGSAGAMSEKLHVRDIVLGQGACTDSAFGSQYGFRGTVAPIADFALLRTAVNIAGELGIPSKVGSVYSSDYFYHPDKEVNQKAKSMGLLAVEMEAAGLYLTAMAAHKKALAMFQISDLVFTGEGLSAAERQDSFHEMMEVALKTAVSV